MASSANRRDTPPVPVILSVSMLIVLQVASTTGLLSGNTSASQVESQALVELQYLRLLEALERDQNQHQDPTQELRGARAQLTEPNFRLTQNLKAYISRVTEKILSKHILSERPGKNPAGRQRSSAHLTLRDSGLQDPISLFPQRDLHQSCHYPVLSWSNHSFGSHLHNMTVSGGRLQVPRSGRYHLYAQVYFRYPSLGLQGAPDPHSRQLVMCVYKKTAYVRPIQLLKAVGTRCWTPEAETAALSLHQGGLFPLRAGDQVFVSVSSPSAVHPEDSSCYFGASRYDP